MAWSFSKYWLNVFVMPFSLFRVLFASVILHRGCLFYTPGFVASPTLCAGTDSFLFMVLEGISASAEGCE